MGTRLFHSTIRESVTVKEAQISQQTLYRYASKAKVTADAQVPEGYRHNPLYVETKTKRLQLVLQPSVFERVKAKAAESGLSVNEYCHRILDRETKGE